MDCAEMVRALAAAVVPLFDLPVAFFGHSLGALLAFEVSRTLRQEIGISPRHLIVSGRRAPHIHDTDRPLHEADDTDLIAYLREQGGTPLEILDNRELLNMALPALRADLRLLKSHRFVDGEPLGCPISVYGGRTDPESAHGWLEAWCRHTTAGCAVQLMPGGHFFIHSEQRDFLARIAAELSGVIRPSPQCAAPSNRRSTWDGTGARP